MVDVTRIATKLAELSDRLGRVRQHAKPTAEDLAADRDAMDLVAFNLMLSVQAAADIASHVISDEGWPAASTLAESFQRLAQEGVISTPTASALARAVGLRNVVALGYGGADPALVHHAATTGLTDLERFAREAPCGWPIASHRRGPSRRSNPRPRRRPAALRDRSRGPSRPGPRRRRPRGASRSGDRGRRRRA